MAAFLHMMAPNREEPGKAKKRSPALKKINFRFGLQVSKNLLNYSIGKGYPLKHA